MLSIQRAWIDFVVCADCFVEPQMLVQIQLILDSIRFVHFAETFLFVSSSFEIVSCVSALCVLSGFVGVVFSLVLVLRGTEVPSRSFQKISCMFVCVCM